MSAVDHSEGLKANLEEDWVSTLYKTFNDCSIWQTFILKFEQAPQSGGFVSAVDHSEGLKANLEEEGALLQDFHIVFTCKVRASLNWTNQASVSHLDKFHSPQVPIWWVSTAAGLPNRLHLQGAHPASFLWPDTACRHLK